MLWSWVCVCVCVCLWHKFPFEKTPQAPRPSWTRRILVTVIMGRDLGLLFFSDNSTEGHSVSGSTVVRTQPLDLGSDPASDT